MQTISINSNLCQNVLNGAKQITIKKGHKYFTLGYSLLKSGNVTIPIEIIKVVKSKLNLLKSSILQDSIKELKTNYKNLKINNKVTIIMFNRI